MVRRAHCCAAAARRMVALMVSPYAASHGAAERGPLFRADTPYTCRAFHNIRYPKSATGGIAPPERVVENCPPMLSRPGPRHMTRVGLRQANRYRPTVNVAQRTLRQGAEAKVQGCAGMVGMCVMRHSGRSRQGEMALTAPNSQ